MDTVTALAALGKTMDKIDLQAPLLRRRLEIFFTFDSIFCHFKVHFSQSTDSKLQ